MKEKDWIKLDNAATIYPATITRKYASMFRLTITLKENVDKKTLEEALKNIMKRFPTFNYSLKQGFFWCYLERIKKTPRIDNDSNNPMVRKNFDKNYLFRVRLHKNRIAIEYFHALTDGTGAITFLLTLTSEYLRLKYNIKPTYNNLILDPNSEPSIEETEDSFLKYAKKKGNLTREHKAYHIKGTKEKDNIINIITGIINIKELKTLTKKYNTTITIFLVSLLIYLIQDFENTDNKEIKISIPINLRNTFKTKTLRNFSSYINVGIKKDKLYSLEEIIKIIKTQVKDMTTESKLSAWITANVNLMKNGFIRRIPMFIKKHIMSFIEYKMGDGYITTVLSNLGLIILPKEIEEYVTDMNFILGNSRNKSGCITMIGYKDNLYITFSRNIEESELERKFFTYLSNNGIKIKIESNGE